MKLKSIKTFKVLNSRAEPTLAISVNGFWSAAPSGASTGKKEVPTFPQGIDASKELFERKVIPKLAKLNISSFEDLKKVEEAINSVAKPTIIGGSVTVALEFALLKALASDQGKEVYELLGKPKKPPMPLGNLIGGGAHSISSTDFQEFLISPKTKTFTEAALINAEIHCDFKKILSKGDRTFKGSRDDEGAWVTGLSTVEILDILFKEKRNAEKRYKTQILLGIDAAANQLFNGEYQFSNYSPKLRSINLPPNRYYNYIADLIERFDIQYIEDPFEERDAEGFRKLKEEFSDRLVCGDDITVTNSEILKSVGKSMNAVIVKPNQIGSLVKAKEFSDLAKKMDLKTVVSHRAGEMPDTVLAHIALGFGADYFKCGIASGERVAKINEIMRLGF